MSVPITVLGVTSLWPTTGDVGYSAQAEQLQKLLASAVDPISGLYNGLAPSGTGGVGRLAMDNAGNLTFNGATVTTGTVVTNITGDNGIDVSGSSSVTLALGDITPTSVNTGAITTNSNLTFTGDVTNRVPTSIAFQADTTNSPITARFRANGTPTTGSISRINLYSTGDFTNNSYLQLGITGTTASVNTRNGGTGVANPLTLGANDTTGITIDTSGNTSISKNLTMSGTGARIQGDFTNATIANRTLFQTTTLNNGTGIGIIPNGTSQTSAVNLENSSAPADNSALNILINATESAIVSNRRGTGTYLPLKVYTNGVVAATFDTSNNLTVTGTVTGSNLSGTNTGDQTITLTGDVTGTGTGSFATTYNGVVPLTKGGTGQITANASLNALLPSQTGNAGKVLSTNGTDTSWISAGTGTGTVTSVGTAGTVSGLTLTGGPITTTGTVTLGGSITSATAMTGAIATPTYIDFATGATVTAATARLTWNTTYGTLQLGLAGGNSQLQIGQDQVVYVMNDSGSAMTKSQVVYINGASGNRPTVRLARADTDATSAGTIGLLLENISNNQQGFVITNGTITGVNTGGFADGDILYLSPTTAGAYTNVRPSAPNHSVVLGYVIRAHATVGQIFVKVDNGYELNELHNVLITSPTNGQVLAYNSSTSVWNNTATTAALTMPSLTLSSASTGITYNNDVNNHVPTSYQVVADTTNSPITARFRANGTPTAGSTSRINLYSTGDTTNNSYIQLGINNTIASLYTNKGGTGTALPLALGSDNTTAVLIDTSNNVSINNKLTINQAAGSDALELTNASIIRAPLTTSLATGIRTYFQTTDANSPTLISAVPNGTTSSNTGFVAYNLSATANSAYVGLGINSTTSFLTSAINGTGTQLPLSLRINATDALTIDTSLNTNLAGNLELTGIGKRITGDFSNATSSNRVQIQTSTPNSGSNLSVIPNGTSQTATLNVENASTTGNNALISINITGSTASINSTKRGTGTALPLTLGTNNADAITIDTSNVVSFTNTVTGSISGNAATATALQTARTINGTSFNGTANITVTAAAGTLTGTTLNSTVVSSSLTSVGTLTNLTVTNPITGFVTPNVQGPTSVTGTTTINWANKDVTKLTLTGSTAITNSGAVDGQKMILQLVQGGSGSYTVTFTSETKFGTSFTSITLSTAVGTMDMIGLVYSAVNSKYNIVSFAAGY